MRFPIFPRRPADVVRAVFGKTNTGGSVKPDVDELAFGYRPVVVGRPTIKRGDNEQVVGGV